MNWLLLHAAVCLLMTGLCLFVAVVHYPLLARVGTERFVEYERQHVDRTGVVVAPLMLIEIATAAWLSVLVVGGRLVLNGWLWWPAVAALALVWLITFGVNVPQHQRLAQGWHAPTHAALVRWHALRTTLWAVRSGLIVGLLW